MTNILNLIIQGLYILFFARVIISWVAPRSRHPLIQLVYNLTEPILVPIRQVIPPQGGLDLSVMIVFVVLMIVERMI